MNSKSFLQLMVSSNLISEMHFRYGDQLALEMRLELTKHIKLFFDFAYYLGGSPFRLVRDSQSGNFYTKKSWKPHQVVCAILHILCAALLFAKIREKLPDPKFMKHATPCFEFVLTFGHFFYKAVTIKRFWCNADDFVNVVNLIITEKHLPVKSIWFTRSKFLPMLYGFFTVKILASFISGFTFVIPVSSWTPTWWLRRLVAQARFIFQFGPIAKSNEAPEFVEMTLVDLVSAILTLIAYFSRFVFSELCDLIILVFALTLWTPAYFFAMDINQRLINGHEQDTRQTQAFNWSQIYKHFQAIESLSEMVNVAMGTQVTFYLAEGLMFYSIHLNTLFISKDWFKRVVKFCFFVITFHNLYISADICVKMESAKNWLVKKNNIKGVPTDEAYLVLHEIITKDIGIRQHTFTITFPAVSGYLTLIITFFIICLQESDLSKE